ncbi:MAG: uroporphyrinogen-III C-methyltransferase [Sulfurimonas sp. RIFOXYD12_FULL_33_39]|uniref:uroporphyrinogen-III C-methyltransferase n=1 Tax=unclassified Sulfurimonas TaxID=2623549 RepID=UPI0008AD1B9D|nr:MULTISPECIES: uroporphyrinogen-III C-methyltransferase [unclassified Sulfurimonas]OHE02971.1 MAG: uroporphyrinogen-III C-methyltransferase [Sulfurimonas sp. RIFCSPLOWO2_12_FULL_34_6]OHE09885.1 MAG: uroporphyrinogen-III C-methyltransferase [Sulfurimonas sp. RIFOXYD12_FULL_33_39]OHE13607.1 MAG: uroporphyrinogen-III C-methyltransferase [Sulfurimonas sp. RIFOXYD2_FULL_34_21]DAB28200.1 MAG TPA: uroporphyrinogen-III C-methyltransferase [Sulfurimonas sp. UBA10385]
MGKVYLTGAGPGDIELLTLKALRVIKEADVIIYDRLANPDILKEAKNGCEFVYVGKEDGRHIVPQDDINEVIYQNALKYENVVRLKGGDPFVFGRGGEEAVYLQERGIKFDIIPGITSAISAPAYAGIPVTHRGVAVSFRVVTGHESPHKKESQIPWDTFKTDDTIVFLMGLHNLPKISKKLIEIGKAKDYPCAVISKGTTKEQSVVVGTLSNIVEKTKDVPTPALIVVGRVVELREQLKWFEENV